MLKQIKIYIFYLTTKILIFFILIQGVSTTVVRRESSAGVPDWYYACLESPTVKGFEIDSTETYLYFAVASNPLKVYRALTSSGASADVHSQ